MKTKNLIRVSVAAIAISSAATARAQAPAVPVAPEPTIWRFIGIPQGLQKIRDVTINRRGNHPRLERKPPLKRIADPANLESKNPAIKAAAEIKQAEDMKAQKIKAIKFLAKMGCGCYDKEGKITDALIAAMDDCTPDVRLASIEAIESTANGECCTKCGSTSCCSEKVTKRLSEIAYERDDTGCFLEPNAEIRAAAAKALCTCCPNRATGPIEEDVPEEPLPLPTPKPIIGEGEAGTQGIEGEGAATGDGGVETEEDELKKKKADTEDSEDVTSASDAEAEIEMATQPEALRLFQSAMTESADQVIGAERPAVEAEATAEPDPVALNAPAVEPAESVKTESSEVEVGTVKMIGGMAIQPVTISPVGATDEELGTGETKVQPASEPISASLSDENDSTSQPESFVPTRTSGLPLPAPIALPNMETAPEAKAAPAKQTTAKQTTAKQTTAKKRTVATVIGVDQRSGRVVLRSGQPMRAGSSVAVYHHYLTGERLIAHLLIKTVNGNQAIAQATDAAGLIKIESGDRAVCF